MEKFTIPNQNSLDSMEGIESYTSDNSSTRENLKISPEIEKKVMEKVKDMFEYGQAITGIGAKAKSINIWGDHMEFRKNRGNVTLSPDNIREYFSYDEDVVGDGLGISSIINGVFRYGVQTLARFVDENKNIVENYIAKNYSEYRKKIKDEDKRISESEHFDSAKYDGVFFQVEGRSQDIRNEYNGILSGGSDLCLSYQKILL